MAQTRVDANRAFDDFIQIYRDKYPKAVECLEKDRETLLTFYDFPATHWQHIRYEQTRLNPPLPLSGYEPPRPEDVSAVVRY